VTALLFGIGEYLIGLYLSRGVDSPYGAAGSLVVLLVWIYYSAQILLFGAEFTQVYANRYGSRVRPSGQAVFTFHSPVQEELDVVTETVGAETAVAPSRHIRQQIGAGMLGVAVGLLLAFVANWRRNSE
ncbi:MAG: YhjD/YihY/BrkB family envelope integrity protein, partial [Anaerolineae bacterium]